MALTLLKSGDDQARSWWRTGRTAAAAADDRATLAEPSSSQSGPGTWRAPYPVSGLPSRRRWRPGRTRSSALARPRARPTRSRQPTALCRLPDESRAASVFGYAKSQPRFHAGNAWTHLGDTTAAAAEHARALDLYPTTGRMDLTLIHLDRALCNAPDGAPGAAAALASQTMTDLPSEHRSALITYRAQQVTRRVPGTRELRELRQLLALPASERGDDGGDQPGG